MNPHKLLDFIRGEGADIVCDGEAVRLTGEPTVLTPELIAAVRPHKAALADLLRSLPVFTRAEEIALVDWYCNAPRAQRLVMHRAGNALHAAGWPRREADLTAMKEHRATKPISAHEAPEKTNTRNRQ